MQHASNKIAGKKFTSTCTLQFLKYDHDLFFPYEIHFCMIFMIDALLIHFLAPVLSFIYCYSCIFKSEPAAILNTAPFKASPVSFDAKGHTDGCMQITSHKKVEKGRAAVEILFYFSETRRRMHWL